MACCKCKKGRWCLDFTDHFGKRRQIRMRKGSTRTEAEAKLRQYIMAVDRGCYVHATEASLFHEVASAWLAHKRAHVRTTTWEVMEQHVRIHFESIRDVKINKLTLPMVEDLADKLILKGLNVATVRKILVNLGQVMRYAVRHGLASFNPVTDAEKPKVERGPVDEDQVLKPDQVAGLIEATADLKHRTIFMLAAMTGARQGELLGLKWSDVDLASGQIKIRRTYTKGQFFEPKTQKSRRKVDLGPAMRAALIKWRMVSPRTEMDLVFPNSAGKPMNYSNMMRRHFHGALAAAGLPRVKFHSLRHSYASIQLQAGQNVKYVQAQLGHAAAAMTLDTYAHYLGGANPEAAEGLEGHILGTQKAPVSVVADVNKCEFDADFHSHEGVTH